MYLKKIKRSKEAEDRYKKYKNKLVWIIRRHKKEYYGDLLNKNRNNMKATWGIINNVIKSDKIKSALPNYFVKNNYDIDDKTKIANEFNDFFVNVGPCLAANIPTVKDNADENNNG